MESKDDGDSYVTQEMLDRLTANHRGLYSVRYRKSKEDKDAVYEDLVAKFSVCGEVANIDGDEGLIYVRFPQKDSAIRALEKFGKTLRLKVPLETRFSKTASKHRVKIDLDNLVEVRIDRIPVGTRHDEFHEAIKEFSPFLLRILDVSKNEKRNLRFTSAFVKFNGKDKDKAESLKDKVNGMEWKGQKLYANIIRHRHTAVPESNKELNDDQMTKKTESQGSTDYTVEVFFGNIPHTCTEEDVQARLAEFAPFQLKMVKAATSKQQQVAFIKFTPDCLVAAERLVEKMHRTEWKGNKLIVERAKSNLTPNAKGAGGKSKKKAKGTRDNTPLSSNLKELTVVEDEDTGLSEDGLSNLFGAESEQKPVKQPWWRKPNKLLL